MLNFQNPGCLTSKEFYYDYELPLAQAFHAISKRGILVDMDGLSDLRLYIGHELIEACQRMSMSCGKAIAASAEFATDTLKLSKKDPFVNLNSSQQVIKLLSQDLKLKVPKKRGTNGYRESSDEESLQELFAESGNPVIKDILRVRELNKVLGTYVNAKFANDIMLSSYSVTGTVTGRRASKANYLGLGTNGQNQPKHSDLGKRFRRCLIARPGKIFVSCDQIQAEDWIVQGLIADIGGDDRGLKELKEGLDRHARLAAFIFSKPIAQCGKDTPERFMGKKIRHAGNYDMGSNRFAAVMAQEGFTVPESHCNALLEKFHGYDPGIRQIFHKYVQEQLKTTRQITTPFGRTRQFFSLRDFSDNKKIFKEAYAQVPQSTVGDNTGMSVLWLELHHKGYVVMDGHDAVVLELDDNLQAIRDGVRWLGEAFRRVIRFPRGLELVIPIEFEIGYNLQEMKKCADSQETTLQNIYRGLTRCQNLPKITISGAPQLSSAAL